MAAISLAEADVPESAALAAGYAQAFQASGKPTASIFYTGMSQNEEIRGIHCMAAYGGVLLIKLRGGGSQVLDPARIVKITAD